MDRYLEAVLKLHQHVVNQHWDGQAIVGPDPIGKVNWRISRFVRSYLSFVPWNDRYVFMQGQGYWIISNILLGILTKDESYLEIARRCANYVVKNQGPDGGWKYINFRERRHLIGTVEGCWASLGLLAAYRQFGGKPYLDAAKKWYSFLINETGFVAYKDSLVPNFFNRPGIIVPNAASITLWFMAELSQTSNDELYLEKAEGIVQFLPYGQMENGEFEYHFHSRPHFMCYQYNAYQFLDLANYYELTADKHVFEILDKLASYLLTGATERGSAHYDCYKDTPEVNYWTAALAAALRKAHELDLGNYLAHSERVYNYLINQQRPDGGFDFSTRNYGLLRDARSYPRPLAMILFHLLDRVETVENNVPEKAQISQIAVDKFPKTQEKI